MIRYGPESAEKSENNPPRITCIAYSPALQSGSDSPFARIREHPINWRLCSLEKSMILSCLASARVLFNPTEQQPNEANLIAMPPFSFHFDSYYE